MGISRAFKLLTLLRRLVKSEYASASEVMGELHGLPQKFGQHLTLYQGRELDPYFQQLCVSSQSEKIQLEQVLDSLNFAYDESIPFAQASIGQVYKVCSEGNTYALKVKYPDIEKRIASDFRVLRFLAAPLKLTPLKNNAMLELAFNLEKLLLKECYYQQEAAFQRSFSRLFIDDEDVLVPSIITNNDNAIISEWADGKTLLMGKELAGTWFVQAYLKFMMLSLNKLGMVHSDPHAGNFIIKDSVKGKKLAVIDYGSVIKLSAQESSDFSRLLLGDYESEGDLKRGLANLGVSQETLEAYEPVLGDIVTILLEPFYTPEEYDFSDWRLQYKLNTLLASRQWEQPLRISPQMLMLLRALHGLYYYARSSSVKLNWYNEIRNYLR